MNYPLITAALAVLDVSAKQEAENRTDIVTVHNNKWDKDIPLVLTGGILGVWAYLLLRGKKGSNKQKLALSLLLAGASSNLYDKITRDYVIDYINIPKGRIKNLYFNLGDVFILIGSLLL